MAKFCQIWSHWCRPPSILTSFCFCFLNDASNFMTPLHHKSHNFEIPLFKKRERSIHNRLLFPNFVMAKHALLPCLYHLIIFKLLFSFHVRPCLYYSIVHSLLRLCLSIFRFTNMFWLPTFPKIGSIPASFSLFSLFQYSWELIKNCRRLDLNRGSVVLEVTVPQPLPLLSTYIGTYFISSFVLCLIFSIAALATSRFYNQFSLSFSFSHSVYSLSLFLSLSLFDWTSLTHLHLDCVFLRRYFSVEGTVKWLWPFCKILWTKFSQNFSQFSS